VGLYLILARMGESDWRGRKEIGTGFGLKMSGTVCYSRSYPSHTAQLMCLDLRIQITQDDRSRLYPATRSMSSLLPILPLKTLLSSAVRPFNCNTPKSSFYSQVEYTKSVEDISDHEHIREAVEEEITATYSKDRAGTSYDPFRGHTIGVVSNPRVKTGKIFLVFPTGEIGSRLRKLHSSCSYS